MLSGDAGKSERSCCRFLPPVPLCDITGAALSQEGTDPEWREPESCRVAGGKPRYGARIEVVVVIV